MSLCISIGEELQIDLAKTDFKGEVSFGKMPEPLALAHRVA
jgi:hypothetical protein